MKFKLLFYKYMLLVIIINFFANIYLKFIVYFKQKLYNFFKNFLINTILIIYLLVITIYSFTSLIST